MSPARFVAGRLAVLAWLAGCAPYSVRTDERAVDQLALARAMPPLPSAALADEDERLAETIAKRLEQPLTVDAAIEIALTNQRGIRAELASLGIARGRLLQAGVVRNPEIGVEARAPVTGGRAARDLDWELHAGFDLTDVILRRNRTAGAAAEVDATRAHVAAEVVRLIYEVQTQYVMLQALSQKQALWQRTTATMEASYQSAKALFAAGNLPEINLASEEAAWQQSRIALAEAELRVLDATEQLAQLLGLPSTTTLQLKSALPEALPPVDEDDTLEARALTASLELESQRGHLRSLAAELGLAESASWLPELSLGVTAKREGTDWTIGPSLRASLPVSSQQRGAVRIAQSELGAQRSRYVAKAIEIRSRVRQLRNRVVSAERRVHHYQQQVLPLRDRIVAQAVRQYNAMQLGVFQLLDARRGQIETNQLYIDALAEYWQARVGLECVLRGYAPPAPPTSGGTL